MEFPLVADVCGAVDLFNAIAGDSFRCILILSSSLGLRVGLRLSQR
jgi:hypothetical protein